MPVCECVGARVYVQACMFVFVPVVVVGESIVADVFAAVRVIIVVIVAVGGVVVVVVIRLSQSYLPWSSLPSFMVFMAIL